MWMEWVSWAVLRHSKSYSGRSYGRSNANESLNVFTFFPLDPQYNEDLDDRVPVSLFLWLFYPLSLITRSQSGIILCLNDRQSVGCRSFPLEPISQAMTCSTFECLTALALSLVPFPDALRACMHSVIQSIPRSEEALDEQQRRGRGGQIEGFNITLL